MIKVGLLNLGSNNLFSIRNALKKIDINVSNINHLNDYEDLKPDLIILPGVGSFPSAMKKIKKERFDKLIFDHNEKNKPILGICLGAQLMLNKSYEFQPTKGLGLIDGDVKSLKDFNIITPNINWLKTECKNEIYDDIFNNQFFYHVHSFYINPSLKEEVIATVNLGKNEICVAYKKNNIIGLQFHPEKSGKAGINLLDKIINEIFSSKL